MTMDMIIVGLIAKSFLCGAFVIGAYAVGKLAEMALDAFRWRRERENIMELMSIERPKAPQWFDINSFTEHQEALKKAEVKEFTVERNGRFIVVVDKED